MSRKAHEKKVLKRVQLRKEEVEEATPYVLSAMAEVGWKVWNPFAVRRAYKIFAESVKGNPKLARAETNPGMLIGLFVFILIGIVLLPTIVTQINNLTGGTSPQVTGSTAQILNLVPLFYTLILLIVPAVLAYKIYQGKRE